MDITDALQVPSQNLAICPDVNDPTGPGSNCNSQEQPASLLLRH